MKKFFLGSVALAAMFAGPAMAADMPVAPPPPPVVYYDWSGAYVGFNAGGVWADVDRRFPTPFQTTGPAGGLGPAPPGGLAGFTTSSSEGIAGFHAGAQWQWGAWVLGAEAALSGCWNECRSQSGLLSPPGITANTFGEHKITNLFTAGGKLGYAWDRWMIYASGGWASANLKSTYCNAVSGICGPSVTAQGGASRNDGWYAGGGLDFMVHKGALVDVLLGVEYQHFDVGSETAFCNAPNCGVAHWANHDLSAKGDLVRAKLTIKSQGYSWFATR
jgi:outer membrane immunogenic protein